MILRPKTGKRLATSASFPNQKIVPAVSIHSNSADDQKTIHRNNFKKEKLHAGIQAADNREYVKAVKQFSLIKPDTTKSLYLCGCARLELKYYSQTQEAIVDFTNCIELAAQTSEPSFILDLWYRRALAYHNIGKYDEAIQDYDELIKRCRSLGEQEKMNLYKGLLGRGLTYQAIYELNMALEDIKEANKLTNNSDPYYLCCRAGVYVSKNEREKAQEDLNRASDMDCDRDAEALLQRAIVLRELGQHDDALVDLQKASKLSGLSIQQADICFQHGLNEYALKNKEKAFDAFTRAITFHPRHAQAYLHLGMLQAEKEHYKDALKSLTRANELAPQQSDILLERANVNRQLGRLDDAAHDQQRGLRLSLSSSAIITMLAARIKKLREGIVSHGASAHTHLELAVAYDGLINQKKNVKAKLEYYKEGAKEYQAAIETDTKGFYPQARALLILCQKKVNKLLEAHELHLEFYDILEQNEGAVYHWKTYLLDVQDKMEAGKLEPHLDENAVIRLIQMEFNRRKKKTDEETFENDNTDKYKYQLVFYEKFRVDLSHVLAAINIFSLDKDAIIQNIQSTPSKAGKIVEMFTGNLTSVSDIESILKSGDKVNLKAIQKADLDYIKMKLKVFGNIGDLIDQIDVTQLVARHLCTRYRSQFGCLKAGKDDTVDHVDIVKESSSPWWKCCGSNQGLSPKQSTYTDESVIADKISTFATAFIIHAINSETIKASSNEKSSRKDALATTLVLVVNRAHRYAAETSFSPKVRQGKDSLPIEPTAVLKMLERSHVPTEDMIAASIEWDLYDFFRAPGIYFHSDDGARKHRYYGTAEFMKPNIYGYRLGTWEEVDVLRKINKNKESVSNRVKN